MDVSVRCVIGHGGALHAHRFVALGPGGERVAVYEDLGPWGRAMPVVCGLFTPGRAQSLEFATLAEAFAQLLPGCEVPAVCCRAVAGAR